MNTEKPHALPFHYWLLWGAVFTLSVATIVLFTLFFETKHQVADAAAQAASVLQQAQAQSSSTPLTASVTIDETFSVPIKTVIPVHTTVSVPVVIPIIGQTVTIKVPIDTTVPIDVVVRIPIKKSIPINTKINTSAFSGILQQLQSWLTALATEWGAEAQ